MLSYENATERTSHARYYVPKAKVKDYNVMINGKSLFDQPIKNYYNRVKTLEKLLFVRKMVTTGSALDRPCFKENYIVIAIDLSKQQALHACPKVIQQINLLQTHI